MPHKDGKPKVRKNDDDKRKRKFRWTKLFRRNSSGGQTKGENERGTHQINQLSPGEILHNQQLKLISKPILPGEISPNQINGQHPMMNNDKREHNPTINKIHKPKPGAPVLRLKTPKRLAQSLIANKHCSVVEILDRNNKKTANTQLLTPTTCFTRPASCILTTPVANMNRNLIVESTPQLLKVPYDIPSRKTIADVSSVVECDSVIKEVSESVVSSSIEDKLDKVVSGRGINTKKPFCNERYLSSLPPQAAGINQSLSEKVMRILNDNNNSESSIIQDELIGITKEDLISVASSASEYIIIRF